MSTIQHDIDALEQKLISKFKCKSYAPNCHGCAHDPDCFECEISRLREFANLETEPEVEK